MRKLAIGLSFIFLLLLVGCIGMKQESIKTSKQTRDYSHNKIVCDRVNKIKKEGIVDNIMLCGREKEVSNRVSVYYFDEKRGIWRFGRI
jgi:hypothetical protein